MINSNPEIISSCQYHTWIVGCGDIGRRVASLYQIQDAQTSVTVRSKESAQLIQELGEPRPKCFTLDLDANSANSLTNLSNTNIYYFVPPPRQGRKDTRIKKFLQNITATANEQPRRIVLISTTGVYGDCKGEWIDESRPVNPVADRAWRRVDAEQQIKQWADQYNKEYVILRVPGIYAQDRLPLQRLKQGLPVVNEAESPWTNRIHADDLATACYLAMQANVKKVTINISDGHPSTMTEYFNHVADYAKLQRPPQITLERADKELSKGMLSYMKESRKISNKKMLDLLGIELRYPSLLDCLKK